MKFISEILMKIQEKATYFMVDNVEKVKVLVTINKKVISTHIVLWFDIPISVRQTCTGALLKIFTIHI